MALEGIDNIVGFIARNGELAREREDENSVSMMKERFVVILTSKIWGERMWFGLSMSDQEFRARSEKIGVKPFGSRQVREI